MRLNVWTAYRLALRTKTGGDGSLRNLASWTLRHIHQPSRLSWLLTPIDFLRYREFDFALRAISKIAPPKRVLDLSSPKLLPLTLGHCFENAQVLSTDVLSRECEWTTRKAVDLGLTNITTQVEDARRLSFPDASFDLITSISVFEHIAPEIDGDLPAIAELARVLAPGGTAILTVPCAKKYMADYVRGDVYERTAVNGPTFFQRFYTRDMLHKRFAGLPDVSVESIQFVEERFWSDHPRQRVAHWVNCSLRQNRIFGPTFPLLSHLFLSPPRPWEFCGKPYIACIVLRKPKSVAQTKGDQRDAVYSQAA
jgi:ubiquinone/menaquinone biosynthesis C-methylase UbiE